MHDFIRIIDDALDPAFCDSFMRTFDASQHLVAGTTTSGVDAEMKDSQDLYLNDHPAYARELQYLVRHSKRQLMSYVADHLHMMIGAFHLQVPHPRSGDQVVLSADNFTEAGRPQFPQLMDRCFRIGRLQAQRYARDRGGYHYWHSETYPSEAGIETLHRVLLFMFYLNDVAEGGETEFLYQERKVAPKKGRMVIAPAYFTHTHRGNVPRSSDKYIVTSWLMFQPSERIYG